LIYTVECSFSDPGHEDEWNAFYSDEKLPALISVHGFFTSQRFRRQSGHGPTYLAVHSIADSSILRTDEYRAKGGGNFARWQQWITDWHRNVYAGIDIAPPVGEDRCLVLGSRPFPGDVENCSSWELFADDLDRDPPRRWMSLVATPPAAVDRCPADVTCYMRMGAQLKSSD
jgi:hypothetical protein